VTRAIKGALVKRGAVRAGTAASSAKARPASAAPAMAPRSSNLRITKRFTDQDKDQFLHEAFDYIAKYFEGSLAELSARNPGINSRFRRIDANRFTAVAYRNGEAVARCAIRIGGRTGYIAGITYSHDDSAPDGSYNESLSVEHDDQRLYLRPLGMSIMQRGSHEENKLSMEGGAEFYWELFIEPLQRG
jgi:hypothetical protein